MSTEFKLPVTGKLFRGDTIIIQATVNQGGVAVDLTGYEIKFTAKKSISDNDSAGIQKSVGSGIVVVNAARGEIDITIAPADTIQNTTDVTYVCDIQLKKAGVISTVAIGTLTVSLDVTQAT